MTLAKYLFGAVAALAVLALFHIDPALAQEAAEAAAATPPHRLDTGDTAWMLTSTAIVLMMTIPGLALFYGGMVRKKNVLSVVMQCFAITCLITFVWFVGGLFARLHRRREPQLLYRRLVEGAAQGGGEG